MLPLLCFPCGDNELCPAWASWDKVWWSRHHLRYACHHAKDSFAPVYKNSTSYFDHNALCFNGCTETWDQEIQTYWKRDRITIHKALHGHLMPVSTLPSWLFPLLLSLWHNVMSSTIASLLLREYSRHILVIPP